MRFTDYISLALRNIMRQKLRSILTILAIVIGSASVAIMLTIVFSAKGFITNEFESNGTFQQIEVSPQQSITWGSNNGNCQGQGGSATPGCVKLTDTLVNEIAKLPHVIGVTREVQINGAFDGLFFGNKKLQIQQMVAYDANGILTNHMLAGRDIDASDGPGVLTISSDYANALGYKNNYGALIGKTVTLHSSSYYSGVGSNPEEQAQYMQTNCNNDGQNCSPPATELTGKIIGISDASSPVGGDSYTIRVPLSWAQGMEEQQQYSPPQPTNNCQSVKGFCQPTESAPVLTVTNGLAENGYSQLIVKVDEASNAAAVAKQINRQFGVGAADAETAIKQQLSLFNILGYILGGIGGIALAVAAVGVVNTMIMSILERTREIGVMRAVGARRSTVSRLFTFEASLLGFIGGLVGLLISYGLTLIGNPLINHQLKGNNIGSSNILAMPPWLIIGVIVGTTVIGLLAGLYPARRAAKLDPVEALRFE